MTLPSHDMPLSPDHKDPPDTVCGFTCLAGVPNVGKSTLMNRLLGEELAIISPRPQTTWRVVRGILTAPAGQIIFVDTPGMTRHSRDPLGGYLVSSARQALSETDLNMWMVDCRQTPLPEADYLRGLLPQKIPAFLIINKVDLYSKPGLLPLIDAYRKIYPFREIIPVSALRGDNVDTLLGLIWKYLPHGPLLFPPDQLADQPEREIVREFIREKVFLMTREEIPYSTVVTVEEMKEREGGKKLFIHAVIHVEKQSQKGIVVGKKGEMVKKIGTAARRRIESFLGVPVYLELRVKVREKWRSKKSSLRDLGFRV